MIVELTPEELDLIIDCLFLQRISLLDDMRQLVVYHGAKELTEKCDRMSELADRLERIS